MKKKLIIFLIIIIFVCIFLKVNKKEENENSIETKNETNQVEVNIEENIIIENSERNIVNNETINEEKKENNEVKEESISYTIENNVNEEKREPAQGSVEKNKKYSSSSNKNCGISFKDDNDFELDLGSGNSITGTYKIENNSIICTTQKEITSEGNRVIMGELVFKIVDEKLKLINISVKGNSVKLNEKNGIKLNLEYTK